MHTEDDAPRPHPLRTEAFIRDLASVEMTHTPNGVAPPQAPRGIGYHLRWIAINIILIAAGAYTFTHYLTQRALGPDALERPAPSHADQNQSRTPATSRRSSTD